MEKDDSLGVKMKFSCDEPFVTMSYSISEENGVYRLSGANVTNGKILEGSGEKPNGDSFKWVAVRQNDSKKTTSEKKGKRKRILALS